MVALAKQADLLSTLGITCNVIHEKGNRIMKQKGSFSLLLCVCVSCVCLKVIHQQPVNGTLLYESPRTVGLQASRRQIWLSPLDKKTTL